MTYYTAPTGWWGYMYEAVQEGRPLNMLSRTTRHGHPLLAYLITGGVQ